MTDDEPQELGETAAFLGLVGFFGIGIGGMVYYVYFVPAGGMVRAVPVPIYLVMLFFGAVTFLFTFARVTGLLEGSGTHD